MMRIGGKTRKELCLEQWEWLRNNPDKDKLDYNHHLNIHGRSYEIERHSNCWACQEAYERMVKAKGHRIRTCSFCPINWSNERNSIDGSSITCMSNHSVYKSWYNGRCLHRKEFWAMEMIKLINETWIEEEN